MKVGYIGLGDIGAPMAERILRGGFDLAVWNRTQSKMSPLIAAGASAAMSPADLAQRCDIVLLCVDSAAAVERLLFESDGVVCRDETGLTTHRRGKQAYRMHP